MGEIQILYSVMAYDKDTGLEVCVAIRDDFKDACGLAMYLNLNEKHDNSDNELGIPKRKKIYFVE